MTESSNEPIRLKYLIPAQYQSWCKKVDDPNWVHHRYRDAKDNAMASAIRELRDSRAQVERLTQERNSALVTLASSEEYRRAYQAGKMAMYSMGEPFTSAAMDHLPCGEGALDRRFAKLIEMPRIAALQQQVSALRDALKDALDFIQDQVYDADDMAPAGGVYRRGRRALTQSPESGIKGALAKMSPQLRNVLYDLIRKVPALADHGDQQAMDEFIAEVKP